MDRFVWTSGLLEINETLVIQQRGVRVYDGEEKVGRRPPRPAGPHARQGLTLGPGLPASARRCGCTVDRGAGQGADERRSRRVGARDGPVPPGGERATGTPSPPSCRTGDDLFWAEPGSLARKDFRRRQQDPAPGGSLFAL